MDGAIAFDHLHSCARANYPSCGTAYVARPARSIDSIASQLAHRYPRSFAVYPRCPYARIE